MLHISLIMTRKRFRKSLSWKMKSERIRSDILLQNLIRNNKLEELAALGNVAERVPWLPSRKYWHPSV